MGSFAARCQVAGENDMSVGQINSELAKERREEKAAADKQKQEQEAETRAACASAWWQD